MCVCGGGGGHDCNRLVHFSAAVCLRVLTCLTVLCPKDPVEWPLSGH